MKKHKRYADLIFQGLNKNMEINFIFDYGSFKHTKRSLVKMMLVLPFFIENNMYYELV